MDATDISMAKEWSKLYQASSTLQMALVIFFVFIAFPLCLALAAFSSTWQRQNKSGVDHSCGTNSSQGLNLGYGTFGKKSQIEGPKANLEAGVAVQVKGQFEYPTWQLRTPLEIRGGLQKKSDFIQPEIMAHPDVAAKKLKSPATATMQVSVQAPTQDLAARLLSQEEAFDEDPPSTFPSDMPESDTPSPQKPFEFAAMTPPTSPGKLSLAVESYGHRPSSQGHAASTPSGKSQASSASFGLVSPDRRESCCESNVGGTSHSLRKKRLSFCLLQAGQSQHEPVSARDHDIEKEYAALNNVCANDIEHDYGDWGNMLGGESCRSPGKSDRDGCDAIEELSPRKRGTKSHGGA